MKTSIKVTCVFYFLFYAAHIQGADLSPEQEQFITEAMIKASAPDLEKPYADAPYESTSSGGVTIYRPNHGLVQGARVAADVNDLIKTILASPNDSSLKQWLTEKIKSDPNFTKKISLAALNHRAGRTDETDSISDRSKRTKELAGSSASFEKAVPKSEVKFTSSEIEDYKKAIELDGSSNSNTDQTNISKLLRAGHVLDLLRVGAKLDSDVSSRTSLSREEVAKAFDRAQNLLEITGNPGYSSKFVELSKNPKSLAQTLVAAQKSTSAKPAKRSAKNCNQISPKFDSFGATHVYQALLRLDYIDVNGIPSVDFVLVQTTNGVAPDSELFSTPGVARSNGMKPLEKTVIRGLTTDDLKASMTSKMCDDWANESDSVIRSVTPGTSR